MRVPLVLFLVGTAIAGLGIAVRAATATACFAAGQSDACACGANNGVSCELMEPELTSVPLGIPSSTTELRLGGNKISEMSLVISNLVKLEYLDFRRNNFRKLRVSSMDGLTRLKTLNMQGNILDEVEGGALDFVTQLETLDLASNNFASLHQDTFTSQTQLKTLKLNNNNLGELHPKLFSTLTSLETLHLERNFLTELPVGLFDNNVNLLTLHLELNIELRIIPPGLFANTAQISRLRMSGCATDCAAGAGGNIFCDCAPGYIGNGGNTNEYCTPKDCGAEIIGLDENANENCTGLTIFTGDPCAAECREGFIGDDFDADSDAIATFTCEEDGVWHGQLTCTAVSCPDRLPNIDDISTNGQCSGENIFEGPNCEASCKEGYIGDAIEYSCSNEGQWVPIGGQPIQCEKISCDEEVPNLVNAQASQCGNPKLDDTCSVACETGYEGGPATFQCQSDGTWFGALFCAGKDCGREIPGLVNAKAKCRGDTSFDGTPCVARCDPGFDFDPLKSITSYTCSSDGTWITKAPLQCDRQQCTPVISKELLHPDAIEPNCFLTGRLFDDRCTATCREGFEGSGTYRCNELGHWAGDMTCTRVSCSEPLPVFDDNFEFTCNGTKFEDRCVGACNLGYTGPQKEIYCDADGKWVVDFTQEQLCFPDCDSEIPGFGEEVTYNCTARQLGDECIVQCADEFIPLNEASPTFMCNSSGLWEGDTTPYGCEPKPVVREVVTEAPTVAPSSGSSISIAMIIGAGIGGFLLLLLIMLVFFKRRNNKPKDQPEDELIYGDNTGMFQNPAHGSFRATRAPDNFVETSRLSVKESNTDSAFPAWAEEEENDGEIGFGIYGDA